jgi:hypothetical protein
MRIDFAQRLNIITGDNGLGKSFILDIAWWVLSRTWSGMPAFPQKDASVPSIEFSFEGKTRTNTYESKFDRASQSWTGKKSRPSNPGLVIYGQVDGSFSVWDPARNYWKNAQGMEVKDRPPAYLFRQQDVWHGLVDMQSEKQRWLCNGLISDWASWQKEQSPQFKQFCKALEILSPSPDEPLKPGKLTRISLDDVRDIPTLSMPYGQDVPVLHASAGMKRILALAYLLVWTWQEHVKASELLGKEPTRQIIFLIDEIEGHLHPKWQRQIFHALLELMSVLIEEDSVSVQVIAATHSPLILTSLEPLFVEDKDKLFDLEIVKTADVTKVELIEQIWRKHGVADNWLTSSVFGLESARSLMAERAIKKATEFMQKLGSEIFLDGSQAKLAASEIDRELKQVLGDMDPFWIRWSYLGKEKGWLE